MQLWCDCNAAQTRYLEALLGDLIKDNCSSYHYAFFTKWGWPLGSETESLFSSPPFHHNAPFRNSIILPVTSPVARYLKYPSLQCCGFLVCTSYGYILARPSIGTMFFQSLSVTSKADLLVENLIFVKQNFHGAGNSPVSYLGKADP